MGSSLFASKGIPSATHLEDSLSVIAFLQFRIGNTSVILPPGGWYDLYDNKHLITAIQCFITDVFGNVQGHKSFMYRALDLPSHHLESSILAHAWESVKRCNFSIVILEIVHSF